MLIQKKTEPDSWPFRNFPEAVAQYFEVRDVNLQRQPTKPVAGSYTSKHGRNRLARSSFEARRPHCQFLS